MIITCTVINKIPSVPYKTELVADNRHQYTVRFVFDDEWESFGTKTARVVINGTASEIDFTGDAIELPLLPSDCSSIELGVYAGDLSTTAPVRIPVRGSILSLGDSEYDPDAPEVVPSATDITLDDLLRLNDVSAGQWVKATLRQILALAGAAVEPSDVNPLADGTASPGESSAYARGDHRHPTDGALAQRIGTLESNTAKWDAKYGPDLDNGTIPEEALEATTRLKIARGVMALEGLAGKVDKAQGVANAGKVLGINAEGDVEPVAGGGSSVQPYTSDPAMDGVASAGSSDNYARGDHVHPSDTSKYTVPSGGIPKTDLASAVQTSLGKADTAYQLPVGGIPASDIASGVIPTVPAASSATPQALGTAAAGISLDFSRADHVHKKPTARDIGAIEAPSSPATGAFLVYNGIAWTAQTLATWQGGNY